MEEKDKLKKDFDTLKEKHGQLDKDFQAAKEKYVSDIEAIKKEHDEKVQKIADKIQKDSKVPMTDTVAKQEAEKLANEAGAVTVSAMGLGNLGNSTSTSITGTPLNAHPNDVKFNVTDSKDSGFQKGITVVSKEVGEHLEAKGYGKIVK